MTQPDIYTVEARRRSASEYRAFGLTGRASAIREGIYDQHPEITILAATLRELNWQPPVERGE